MMSTESVVSRYASQKANIRTGCVRQNASCVYCDGRTIYSFGSHFPMAYLIKQDSTGNVFVKNGDRASQTTSRHQALVQFHCSGPTVSFSALNSAGVPPVKLRFQHFIAYRPDQLLTLIYDPDTGKYTRKDNGEPFDTKVGMRMSSWKNKDGTKTVDWHILGTSLIHYKNGYYLCSSDESNYYVIKLSKRARTFEEAFRGLKPRQVRKAEHNGIKVKRQGEWFFVPTGMQDKEFAAMFNITQKRLGELAKSTDLPQPDTDMNIHNVKAFKSGKTYYCKGCVRHLTQATWKDPRRATGEHRMLKLGNEWHRAYRNTELESWGANGRLD